MAYLCPTIPDDIADRLWKEYQREKNLNYHWYQSFNLFSKTKQRYAFLTLLKRISAKEQNDPRKQEVLLHCLAFGYAKTPGPNWLTNGSMLHRVIGRDGLKLKEGKEPNQISAKELYYYLEEFDDYVTNNLENSDVADLYWGSKTALKSEIHHRMRLTQDYLKQELNHVANAPPDLDVLANNVKTAVAKYRIINDKRPNFSIIPGIKCKNKDRINTCNRWEFLVETCKKLYPYDTSDETVNAGNYYKQRLLITTIVLLTCKEIADRCTLYNGSDLFQLGLDGINLESIKKISEQEQEVYYGILYNHLLNLKSTYPDYFNSLTKQWVEYRMDDYMTEVSEMQAKIVVNSHKSGMGKWLLSRVFGWGAGIVVAQAASQFGLPLLFETIPVAVAGIPGVILVASIAGSMIMIPMVAQKVGELGRHIFTSGVEAAGNQLGNGLARIVATGKVDKSKRLEICDTRNYPPEEKRALYNLITAWLKSPDNIIPRKTKLKLAKQKGLDLDKHELPKEQKYGVLPVVCP